MGYKAPSDQISQISERVSAQSTHAKIDSTYFLRRERLLAGPHAVPSKELARKPLLWIQEPSPGISSMFAENAHPHVSKVAEVFVKGNELFRF